MGLEAVTFDVWNTLMVHEYYDDRLKNHRMKCIRQALGDAGIAFTCPQIKAAYDYTEECLSSTWKSERDVSLESHLGLFLEGLGLELDDDLIEIIREPYAHALLHFRPQLIDGAADLLKGLQKQGYRIGLISNTGRTPGRTMRIVLEDYDISGCFDAMIFSDEIGYIKPNRKIFEKALAGLGTLPEKAVHVGDHPLLDVYGARACGWKAIHFTRYMANFEKYAAKYYSANGRVSEPDWTTDSLGEVEKALEAMR